MTVSQERINIINKIVNLLAKADSTTFEAEAESARKLAAKLMTNFEIKKSELEKDEVIVKVTIPSGNEKRKNMKHATLYHIVSKYCGVYMVTCGSDYILCGKNNDIEAAQYMFSLIWNQIVNMTDNWYQRNKRLARVKHKNQYMFGLLSGVNYNLDKINNSVFKYKKEYGLVPVNQNDTDFSNAKDAYTKNNKVKERVNNVEKSDVFNQGFVDSENIKMKHGVAGNKTYSIGHK